MNEKAQPYKFRLVMKDGSTVEGGAETRALCIAHCQHCYSDPEVVRALYLGKYGQNRYSQLVPSPRGAK